MDSLRASGYTTVILWTIHVDSSSGDLILNDKRVVSDGVYVGDAAWPGQLATLKRAPTSVTRIEVGIASWGVNDFLSIQTLMNTHGTNTTSILYRNFLALKNATGADAVNLDDEMLYDVDTTVKFSLMCVSMGYKVALCPYTRSTFWSSCYSQINSRAPGAVDAVYLQCYAGGAGNNPATWNSYFGGLKVIPGLWSRHGGGCAEGDSPATVATKMLNWKNTAGVTGGFMWLYDDMLACASAGTAAQYANAINSAFGPAAPGGLTATPSAGSVLLYWRPAAGALSYNVKRSSSANGIFTTVKSGVTNLHYWDQGLAAGSTWFYQVSSANAGGEGSNSLTVAASPCAGWLPAGWFSQDIGNVGVAGAASHCGGSLVLHGSGSDIYGQVDGFRFAGRSAEGSAGISARVGYVEGVNGWTKAGVMFRADTGADSMFVDVVLTPGNGIAMQWRDARGGASAGTTRAWTNGSAWVQLVRRGNVFTGYYGADGQNWVQIGSVELPLPVAALAGLAVTAGDNTVVGAAMFDSVGSGAPLIIQQPQPESVTRFVGARFTLSAAASGAPPVSYQWMKDSEPVEGAIASMLSVNAATMGNAGRYTVVASNDLGAVTSTVAVVNIIDTSTAPYSQAILKDRPIAFWRLNELAGTAAYDYAGGYNGIYTNTALGQAGHTLLDTRRAVRLGSPSTTNSLVHGIGLDFSGTGNAVFSVEAWVNGAAQTSDSGIVTKGYGSGGEQFNLDCGGPNRAFRFFVRSASGGVHLVNSSVVPNSQWHHVVGVCNQAGGVVSLYVDGISAGQAAITPGTGLLPSAAPVTIGSRRSGATTAYDFQFKGLISHVAMYDRALSAAQVQAHFAEATNRPPLFLQDPFNAPAAQAGFVYGVSMAASVTDPNGGALTFVKVSGPAWLTVDPSGWMTGAPLSASVGVNTFQVQVADSAGLASLGTMNITVLPALPVQVVSSLVGSNLLLSWTGGIPPYQLQFTPSLEDATWRDWGIVGENTATIPATNSAGFFRIKGR